MKKIYQAPKTLSIDLQVEGVCAFSGGRATIDNNSDHAGSSNFSEKKDYSSEIWGE